MKTKVVSDTALQPLIDFVNAENGRKAQLTRHMSEALGTTVHRQLVEGWVHPDPEERVEPRMGLGIILLRVGGEMMGNRRPLNLGNTIKKARKLNGAERNGKPRKPKVAEDGPDKKLADAMSGVGVKRARKTLPPSRPTPGGDKAGEDIAPAKRRGRPRKSQAED